ncbi:phage late control D family protein [Microbispora sp. NPDC049125]|uniref:phage late control D family protein n=1 Tax=Microbispora sp. NPDC049125 TaxID=3154929 RepID=UPI0034673279
MNPQSTNLTVLLGAGVPVPAPPRLVESIQRVQVTMSESTRSAFQLVLTDGRSGPGGLTDFPLLTEGSLRPFNRVVLIVTFRGVPAVLMDGVITHQELTPGSAPGSATITVTGEDVSVMMDLEERSAAFPAQDEAAIATRIILGYARYGLVPMVVPPPVTDVPLPIERIPVQDDTDLGHLTAMARRFGYVFFVVPGPAPLSNVAYWGPPMRSGVPAAALSAGPGPERNVEDLTFRHDALAPFQVSGQVQDRLTDAVVPVRSVPDVRPPLAAAPDGSPASPYVRKVLYRGTGVSAAQALAKARGAAESSRDSLVVTGSVDTLRYGGVLRARGLIGLRGAGWQHDGLYHVKQVTHTLTRGGYTQDFTLTREGVGSTTSVVRP